MAIYHLQVKNASRGNGQAAIAMAAYRSGEKLYSDLYEKYSFYGHRNVAPETFILKPEHAPNWALDRETLWNEVERVEKQRNARFAKEVIVAIPHELNQENQLKLVREFVQETFVDGGMVADVAIHRDDENNPHAHIMLTVRPFNVDGTWGAKSRKEYITDANGEFILNDKGNKRTRNVQMVDWNEKETIVKWRTAWANHVNGSLQLNGVDQKVSEKSYKEQGIELVPTIHEGYAAKQIEQRGAISERCEHNRTVRQINANVTQLELVKAEIEAENIGAPVKRALAPKEKKLLSEIAKELKVFVNADTLQEKKLMLHNWHISLKVAGQLDSNAPDVANYEKLKAQITNVDVVLANEAIRIIDKHYPQLEVNQLTDFEKQQLAHETIHHGVLDESLLPKFLEATADYELNTLIKKLNYNSGWLHNYTDIERTMKGYETTLLKQFEFTKESFFNPVEFKAIFEKIPLDEQAQAAKTYKKMIAANESLGVIARVMDSHIKNTYPEANLSNMTIYEKELVINAIRYYGKELSIENLVDLQEVKAPIFKHSKEQVQAVVEYAALSKIDVKKVHLHEIERAEKAFEQLPEKLKAFYHEPSMRSFVFNEAIAYGLITEQQSDTLQGTRDSNSLKSMSATDVLSALFTPKSLGALLGEINAADAERMREVRSKQMKHNRKRYAKLRGNEFNGGRER